MSSIPHNCLTLRSRRWLSSTRQIAHELCVQQTGGGERVLAGLKEPCVLEEVGENLMNGQPANRDEGGGVAARCGIEGY